MATDVNICNIALARAGIDTSITSMSENSPASIKCGLLLPAAIHEVMVRGNWGFATRIMDASSVTKPAASPFAYAYAYPGDCLKVRMLITSELLVITDNGNWSLSDDGSDKIVILTNIETAKIVYTSDSITVNNLPEDVVNAIEWTLARDLAASMQGSADLMQAFGKQAEESLRNALVNRASEGYGMIVGALPADRRPILMRALQYAGFMRITHSVNDNGLAVVVACNIFDERLHQLLRKLNWNFSTTTQVLEPYPGEPDEMPPEAAMALYRFAYKLPATYLRIQDVVPIHASGANPAPQYVPHADPQWRAPVAIRTELPMWCLMNFGDTPVILTNFAHAQAIFTRKVTDLEVLPQDFKEALAWEIALHLAMTMPVDESIITLCANGLNKALTEAQVANANEKQTSIYPQPDNISFIRARRRKDYWFDGWGL